MADSHPAAQGRASEEHHGNEPDERTSLLHDGYLDPDDPAVCEATV